MHAKENTQKINTIIEKKTVELVLWTTAPTYIHKPN